MFIVARPCLHHEQSWEIHFNLVIFFLQVFACTVGQKPSKAPYYVNDPEDVLSTLQRLAESSIASKRTGRNSVSFAPIDSVDQPRN